MDFRLNQQKITPLLPLLLTTVLLLFGFAIWLVGIDSMHMRPDEELTFRNMSFSFYDSMMRLVTRNNQAPLWWIQVWTWQRLTGTSEFAGRMNSILWSMLTLALTYQIGRSWFGERRFGWASMAILSVNSYFFIYALEMRMYALGMLVVTLSMYFFQAWISKKTSQLALMYGLSIAVMLYTHYYFGFIVLAQAAYFLIFHVLDWRLVKQGFIAAGMALLVWFPGIIVLYNQLLFISFVDNGGLNIPTKPSNFETIFNLAQLSSNGLAIFYMIVALLGLIILWRKTGYRLALAWMLISTALVFAINTQAPIYNVRYTSFMIPSVAIAVGAAIVGTSALMPLRRFSWGGQILVLGIVCAVSLYNLPNFIPERLPYRHIFSEITEQYQEGDVLLVHPHEYDLFLGDQFARYLAPELLENLVGSVEEARQTRRIWYLTDTIFDENSQALFTDLESSHRQQVVIGQCPAHSWCYVARLMEASPLDEPLFFGETIGFLGADISPIENNQLAVLLWWMVDETPEADYSISLQLIAADGSLAIQVDRQIDPPDEEIGEIPTSQMQSDGNYIDWRVLDIPPNLENGNYTLQVVVYQWWDGLRLTLEDGTDSFVLQTVTIDR